MRLIESGGSRAGRGRWMKRRAGLVLYEELVLAIKKIKESGKICQKFISCAKRNSIHKFDCVFVNPLSPSIPLSLSPRQPTLYLLSSVCKLSVCSVVSQFSVSQSSVNLKCLFLKFYIQSFCKRNDLPVTGLVC